MFMLRVFCCTIFTLLLFPSCKQELIPVTVGDFQKFVAATNYKTDAEKYEWSIIQRDVVKFEIMEHIDWQCPDGEMAALPENPVTQVSYNDALAYANWVGKKLPTYEQYWGLIASDTRKINTFSNQIFPPNQVNLIGNVWEITTPDNQGRIRLAGGSYLCNVNTCNGTDPQRELFVDKITGNTHISFALIK